MGELRSPTLADVIRVAMECRLMDVHVALPARVEEYDADKQKVNVKPLIKRSMVTPDNEEIVDTLPVINDVPVGFQRGGGFFMSLPLEPGDFVFLIFNERSIDKFTGGSGQDEDPVDLRMHHLNDAVAIPCFYPFGRSLKDASDKNLVLGKDGGPQIHIKPDLVSLFEKNAADFVALAGKVKSDFSAIASALKNSPTAAQDGGATYKAAIGVALDAAGVPNDVGADKVKAT